MAAEVAEPHAGSQGDGQATLLEVEGVSKSFRDGGRDRPVLADVSFRVEAGSAVALCGPSGCGKSTLLNIVAGILQPDSGAVRFHGNGNEASFTVSASNERERARFRRRRVGMVFQFFNLVPTLTAAENVRLAVELAGDGDADRALQRLDALGLGARRDAFPAFLSGGEQQRVAIARALAAEPPLVLADEPTGNLDRANADQVIDALWRETGEAGAALVIATHSDRIATRADRVIELEASVAEAELLPSRSGERKRTPASRS